MRMMKLVDAASVFIGKRLTKSEIIIATTTVALIGVCVFLLITDKKFIHFNGCLRP